MSDAEIKQTLRAWVAKTSGASSDAFTDQTPIFGKGLLKSVHILDLILLIEETSDREIDVERLGPTSFKDIDTIYATFYGARAA
jgi:acyl carrier protein